MTEADARTFGPLVRAGLMVGMFPLVIGGLAAAGGGFSLPSMFVGFALIALMLALGAVWQSLRTAFGGGPDVGVGLDAGMAEREALLAEKETLLTTIKDITFDHEVGKIDEEDFKRMNRVYRGRAKEVLRQLDQDLGPYLDEASKLVDGATGTKGRRVGSKRKGSAPRKRAHKRDVLECGSCGADNDHDALHCDQCGGRLGVAVCPSCGTENDPDAKFCKQCATALGAEPKSSASSSKKKSGKKKSKKKRRAQQASPVASADAPAKPADAGSSDGDEAEPEDAADEPRAGDAADEPRTGDAPDDAPDDDEVNADDTNGDAADASAADDMEHDDDGADDAQQEART
ncbi:MAG: zinc ribbon domain-containing protein [Sandaracinaceae bacterium]